MVISDKQTLRRCVKQVVRRAAVVETLLNFDAARGEMGIKALATSIPKAQGLTPLQADAAAAFAAMDALEMPIEDIPRAALIQSGYTREAYLREILDQMRAKRVFACVSIRDAQSAVFEDDRIAPLLTLPEDFFAPGRYGVEYARRAEEIRLAAQQCGARDVLIRQFDEDALRFCLIPACEDERLRLHVRLDTRAQMDGFLRQLDASHTVCALAFGDEAVEPMLIEAAATRRRLLVRVNKRIPLALEKLGLRFVPYASEADLPEQMLGRWITAREAIWPALCDAYLPLARCGYPLTSEAIARDVQALFGGHFLMDDDNTHEAYQE